MLSETVPETIPVTFPALLSEEDDNNLFDKSQQKSRISGVFRENAQIGRLSIGKYHERPMRFFALRQKQDLSQTSSEKLP